MDALNAQVGIENRIAQLKTLERNNATTSANQKVGKDNDAKAEAAMEARREAADAEIKLLREAGEKTVQQLNQTEREKIDATRAGTAARLQAIVSAIQNEESWGLKDSAFYRQLLMERVNTERAISEEEAKLKEEAGKEDAKNTQRLGELGLAALRQSFLLQDSARRVNAAQIATEETTLANAEFNIKMQAFARELSALDKSGKDYANKLKAIQDKEKQLTQQHENELTAIKEKAEIESNQRILAGWQQFSSQMASGLTQSIMGHQTWARMLSSIGDQVVSGMIQNAIKSMLVADMDKEKQAAKAARAAFNIGMSIGGPAGIVLGPVFGAAAFAAEMAFQGGGVVPGVGRGDIVPAMLEPGEGVVPKGVMEGLSGLAKSGGMSGGGDHYTVHVRPTYHVQTIDGNGMQAALEKHTDVLQRHFESAVRKMNR